MSSVPAPADPGWDEDPARLDRDPAGPEDQEAWLDRLCERDDDPFYDPQEYWDPEACAPPPGQDELTAEELAGIREAAADEMLALDAASTGRRGPGHPGSARIFPGESASRAAGFGTGMAWDVTPGCAQLAVAADAAVGGGPADRFGGVADHELIGLVCAWDRLEAHAAARKLIAIAEVFRRNPEDGFEPEPGQLPQVVHEFTRDQLAYALGESRSRADALLTVAWHLATRLPGTLDALRDGAITRPKAELIVWATQHLDDDEARKAEAKVLGRAGRLTPGGLRSAVARAVMEVAPQKAKKRREQAAKDARVERWAEDSGNAALMGRELPPDEVLAADQRIRWWAGELKQAGLEGSLDELRARAYLDLLLGQDSRPHGPQAADATGQDDAPGRGPAPDAGPAGGAAGGFVGQVTLTVPLGTATGLADRPGGYGTWRLRIPRGGPDLIVAIDTLATQHCAHRYEARGHDPGVKLRHLSQVRQATCTSPVCRRPAWNCDFEHNVSYETGGRTCLCNGGPKCRHDHRLKQQPGWNADQLPDGTFRWTTPSGRSYDTEPTRYPI